MMSIPQMEQDSTQWSEEVREFSHSIAKDCDDAFNSSLLSAHSCLGNAPNETPLPVEAGQFSAGLATPSPGVGGNANIGNDVHPWDRRPLPPTPTSSASTVKHADHAMPLLSGVGQVRNLGSEDEPNRRTVSAPIYSQYSTQWGKDKIPLPPINEKYRDDSRGRDNDKSRTVSAPVGNVKGSSLHMDERAGLEFLAQHENTIRIVDSPAGKQFTDVGPSKPSALRKQLSRGVTAYPQSSGELDLRRRYVRDEPNDTGSGNQDALSADLTTPGPTRKKSSWFKRGSKDKEDVFDTKGDSNSSRTDRLTYTSTNSSGGPAIPPAKKKSFNIAFWRNSKDASEMQMSLAGKGEPYDKARIPHILIDITVPQKDDTPSPKPVSMFSHPARPPQDSKRGEDATTRNIEPQQNWLARLFRVKPATKHLCFSISRRRARQEMVILLKEWRKYGIRDVQVDKERNIVFARVGEKNCR